MPVTLNLIMTNNEIRKVNEIRTDRHLMFWYQAFDKLRCIIKRSIWHTPRWENNISQVLQVLLGYLILYKRILVRSNECFEEKAIEQCLCDFTDAEIICCGDYRVNARWHALHTAYKHAFVEHGKQRAQGIIVSVKDFINKSEFAFNKRALGVMNDAA